MGQKTNPTVLRLEKTNQHFKACWYGHYYYSDQLHNNFKIRDYICKIFQKINRCQPLIYIKNSHQSNQILCFFLKKRMRRYKRFKFKKYSAQPREKLIASKKWSAFYGAALKKAQENLSGASYTLTKDSKYSPVTNLLFPEHSAGSSGRLESGHRVLPETLMGESGEYFGISETADLQFRETLSRLPPTFHKLNTLLLSVFHKQSSLLLRQGKVSGELQIKHRARMENTIDFSNFHFESTQNTQSGRNFKYSPTACAGGRIISNFNPYNTLQDKSYSSGNRAGKYSAVYSPEILKSPSGQNNLEMGGKKTHLYPILVSKVTQNSDFIAQKIIGDLKKRVAYNRLRRQILRDVAKSRYVKGIRVTLSGRVKSQSKKAQKARTNTFHWGQTELHVFSSLVQFTSSHCITPFGKIGVKVWVCYHSAPIFTK